MAIPEVNGMLLIRPEQQTTLSEKQETLTLNSVFEANSDGGEEITQNEYEQLSEADKKKVDNWHKLIEDRFYGEDAKLTKSNVRILESEQVLEHYAKSFRLSALKLRNYLFEKGINFAESTPDDIRRELDNLLLNMNMSPLEKEIQFGHMDILH